MHIHNDGFGNKYLCRIQKPFGCSVHLIFHICMRKYKRNVPHILHAAIHMCGVCTYARPPLPSSHLVLIDVVHCLMPHMCQRGQSVIIAPCTRIQCAGMVLYTGTQTHLHTHKATVHVCGRDSPSIIVVIIINGGHAKDREMKIPPEYCNIYQ